MKGPKLDSATPWNHAASSHSALFETASKTNEARKQRPPWLRVAEDSSQLDDQFTRLRVV
jgi:hypothetical protein